MNKKTHIKRYQEFIDKNMNFDTLDIPSLQNNQKRLREYIKTIRDNYLQGAKSEIQEEGTSNEWVDEWNNFDIYINYFTIIHNFLLLEVKFYKEVKLSNKEINKYLNLKKLNNLEEVIDKFNDLYDTKNNLKFAIETFDSIEEIKVFLDNSDKDLYNKIYFNI